MTPEQVVAQFAEWHLSAALDQTGQGGAALWTNDTVQLVPEDGTRHAFSTLFDEPNAPTLTSQMVLLREDAKRFGFSDEDFRTNFWGLRPDFAFRASDLLVFLEAKGRSAPARTWSDPKERSYYRFLSRAAIPKRGLFYIIPACAATDCARCISQHFSTDPSLRVGFVTWEDLLPTLAPHLLHVAVDELVRATDGLRSLRQWQTEHA